MGQHRIAADHRTRHVVVTLASSLALVAGVLTAVAPAATAQPPATPYPVADLIDQASLHESATTPYGQYYEEGIYSATPAQVTALNDLSAQAVTDTVTLHQLATGDGPAVQGWARTDAVDQLWALMYEAMTTPAAQQSSDQANAVAWLTAVAQRQNILAAEDAGLEYSKWAGLGASTYDSILATPRKSGETDSQYQARVQDLLKGFLSQTPVNYIAGESLNTPESTSNEGYCVYTPPSPDQGQYVNIYTGGSTPAPQDCYTPEIVPGTPPPPTLTDLIGFGDADAQDSLITPSGWTSAAEGAAVGYSLTASLIGGAVLGGLGYQGSAYKAFGSTWLGKQMTPFASRAKIPISLDGKPGAVQGATTRAVTTGGRTGTDLAEDSTDLLETLAQGFNTFAVVMDFAGPAGMLIGNIIALVEGSVQINQELTEPGQIAQLVASAPTTTPDLASLSQTSALPGLYELFVGATVPAPDLASSCDDSQLVAIGGGSAMATAGSQLVPCMNAPAVLPDDSSDPQWVVTPKGAATSTTQSDLSWTNSLTGLTTSTYLAGNWFVDTAAVAGLAPATVQSLELEYTDWSGNLDVAWLFDSAPGSSGGPKFFVVPDSALSDTFDPSTCLSSGVCSWASSIDLVDGSGNDVSAAVSPGTEPAPGPVEVGSGGFYVYDWTTTSVVTHPSGTYPMFASGNYVSATASVSGIPDGVPLAAAGTVTFLDDGVPVPGCATVAFSNPYNAICGDIPLTAAGIHAITVNYSGEAGSPANTTAESSTGQVALDAQSETNVVVTAVPAHPVVGQSVTYTAAVSNVADAPPPTGTVTFLGLDGGTGCPATPLEPTSGGTAAALNPDGTTTTAYTAICTATSQAAGQGGVYAEYSGDDYSLKNAEPGTVTIAATPTTTSVSASPANPAVGDTVTYTATVASAYPATPTGTVTFTDGTQTLCTAVALAAHSGAEQASCSATLTSATLQMVSASYSGDASTTASDGSTVVDVGQGASSTSLAFSDPSPQSNEMQTLTATVSVAGTATPTGTVTFVDDTGGGLIGPTPPTLCTSAVTGTAPPYTATCKAGTFLLGPFTVTATYSGDATYTGSSGTTTAQVGPAESVTTLRASSATPTVGRPVTFTALLTPTPPVTFLPYDDGTYTFAVGGTALCQNVTPTQVGSTGTWDATCTHTFTSTGPLDVTASYSGDSYTLASSDITGLTVQPAPPSAPTALTAIPARAGQVTLSWAAPTDDGGSPVTGYDVFDGTTAGGETSTPACIVGADTTSCTIDGLTGGSTYYFTVTALNSAGAGPASVEAHAVPTSPGTLVSVEIRQATDGTALSIPENGSASYYTDGAWHPITTVDPNGGGREVQADIAPGTYTFAATYLGTRETQKVTVGSGAQTVSFHTALVRVELQAHDGSILSIPTGGSASYYADGKWRSITAPDANNPSIVQAEMLPGSYSFAAVYQGTREQAKDTITVPNIDSEVGATQTVYFHTELVDVELQAHDGSILSVPAGGSASYYADGKWRSIAAPDANNPSIVQAEMLPGSYAFAATYHGTREQATATVTTPDADLPGTDNTQTVYFHTELVDVELQCWPAPGITSSCGLRGDILAGSASYYADGKWRSITAPDANNPSIVQAEMLPGSYSFAATYQGTREQATATVTTPDANLPGTDNTQTVSFHYRGTALP